MVTVGMYEGFVVQFEDGSFLTYPPKEGSRVINRSTDINDAIKFSDNPYRPDSKSVWESVLRSQGTPFTYRKFASRVEYYLTDEE